MSTDPFSSLFGESRGAHGAVSAGDPAAVDVYTDPVEQSSYAHVRVTRSDGVVAVDEQVREAVRLDLGVGDILWLNCVQFDSQRGKFVNQHWSWWTVTGGATDSLDFDPPGFRSVGVRGLLPVELRCPAEGCESSWEIGFGTPERCPAHGEPLALFVKVLDE